MDGYTFLSASYDKKINVYDLNSGKIKYNLPINKSSVTGIMINVSGEKIISCGLDSNISIWKVIRNSKSNESSHVRNFEFKNVLFI